MIKRLSGSCSRSQMGSIGSIEVIPRKTVINATLFGFINVYTIDDITVKPNFHGALHLNFETIALEQALKELQLLP